VGSVQVATGSVILSVEMPIDAAREFVGKATSENPSHFVR
jgi:hypothetical protein